VRAKRKFGKENATPTNYFTKIRSKKVTPVVGLYNLCGDKLCYSCKWGL